MPAEFHLYAIQNGFLRPADGKERVIYDVERIFDGRAYATRIVRASQPSSPGAVFVALLSFQKAVPPTRNVLRYEIPMPDAGGVRPEDIPKDRHHQRILAGMGPAVSVMRLDPGEEPFDWRPLDPHLPQGVDDPTQYRYRGFVRSPAFSTESSASAHQAALAYLSDTLLLGTALTASPVQLGHMMQNLAMTTSLSHNVQLHDPTARVDEWMYGERETSWGADGRALMHQRFWSLKTGRLIMSGTQEGLVRLKDTKL